METLSKQEDVFFRLSQFEIDKKIKEQLVSEITIYGLLERIKELESELQIVETIKKSQLGKDYSLEVKDVMKFVYDGRLDSLRDKIKNLIKSLLELSNKPEYIKLLEKYFQ